MYCKNCGAEIDPGATFCPSCGFDQRPSGSAYTSPGPGSQQGSSWTFTDSSSPELEKKKGAVIGGIIGLVVGYLINLLLVGVILSSMY